MRKNTSIKVNSKVKNSSNEANSVAENAFFCTTPFHVLGCLAISHHVANKTDIYITNQFKDSLRIAGFLKTEGLFHDVIYIDAQEKRIEVIAATGIKKIWTDFHSLLQYLWNCIRIDKTVQRYLHTDYVYRRVFIASNSMAGRYAILSYIKRKKKFSIWQYDDGLGSYSNAVAEAIPLYDRFFRTIFFGRKAVKLKRTWCLFSPEYYYLMNGKSRHIHHVPELGSEQRKLLFKMYDMDSLPKVDPRTLFLDAPNEGFTVEGWEMYQRARSKTIEVAGDVLIKRHPRDLQMSDEERKIASVPFEILCMNWDMSDKIIISSRSSAMYTPKLLFDQEPVLIFLCLLLEKGVSGYKTYGDIDNIRAIYRDKSRVLLPKTEDELIDAINRFL